MIGVIGGSGFVGRYVVKELLAGGHTVINLDLVPFDVDEANYCMLVGDAKVQDSILCYFFECEVIINLAARLGGIKYFHKYPAELLVENERICCSVFSACKQIFERSKKFEKIIQVSSSMVYGNAGYTVMEGEERRIPSPKSVYGFQKLASEYFCQAFYEQYELPYVIVRPFNVFGVGENPFADSHVIPQFILKALQKQVPFEILGNGAQVRSFTHGKDVAKAIRYIVEKKDVVNTDFNIVNDENEITITALARKIWDKINPGVPFRSQLLPGLKYDVQQRKAYNFKAKKNLGWEPEIKIDEALDEIILDVKKWQLLRL